MSDVTGMVNIPRDEIVEALLGVNRIQQADQKSMLSALNNVVSSLNAEQVAAPTEAQSELTDRFMRVLVDAMADNLILNDRTIPLVDPVAIGELAMQSLQEESAYNWNDGVDINQIQRDAMKSFMRSVTPRFNDDIPGDYDRAWRQIDAYRQLTSELGKIDESDQSQRDAFMRRSSNPEEWRKTTDKFATVLSEEVPKMMRDLVRALMAAFMDNDPELAELMSPNESAEFEQELDEQLQTTVVPLMAQINGALRAYRDRRYIELWVEPSMW